jgi:hypothetical protein
MPLLPSLPLGFKAIQVEVKRQRVFQAAPIPRAAGQSAGGPRALLLPSSRCDSSPAGQTPQATVIETNVLGAIQTSTAVLLAAIHALKDHVGNASNALPTGDAQHDPEKPKRKYKPRQTPVVEETALKDRKWLTFKQAAARGPLSEQALRRLGYQAEQHLKDPKAGLRSNGFERCIVRPRDRTVLIDADELDRWIAAGHIVKSEDAKPSNQHAASQKTGELA